MRFRGLKGPRISRVEQCVQRHRGAMVEHQPATQMSRQQIPSQLSTIWLPKPGTRVPPMTPPPFSTLRHVPICPLSSVDTATAAEVAVLHGKDSLFPILCAAATLCCQAHLNVSVIHLPKPATSFPVPLGEMTQGDPADLAASHFPAPSSPPSHFHPLPSPLLPLGPVPGSHTCPCPGLSPVSSFKTGFSLCQTKSIPLT